MVGGGAGQRWGVDDANLNDAWEGVGWYANGRRCDQVVGEGGELMGCDDVLRQMRLVERVLEIVGGREVMMYEMMV